MLGTNATWTTWLEQCGQPVLFAIGGNWRAPRGHTLANIQSELRVLGARLVAGNREALFCLGPDDAPAVVPPLDQLGWATLYETLDVNPGDPRGPALTLTLVDDRVAVRMRTSWSSADDAGTIIADLLVWARQSLVESAKHWALDDASSLRVSPRELVVLSLMGALARPIAAAYETHASKTPRRRQVEA